MRPYGTPIRAQWLNLFWRFAQLAGHQQAAGGFHVGVAAGHKLGVIGWELAQHPVSQIIIRARLGANANADAVKISAAGGSDNAL